MGTVARAAPEPASSDIAIVREAREALNAAANPGGPGIVVLVARGDRIVYRSARGRADIELGVPLAPNQLFRIASVTKIFTAALVLQLAQAGALSLDDPLSRFLPDFPNGARITIRQLLSHRAGISDQAANPQPGGLRRDWDMATLVSDIARRMPAFPPGTDQSYSNAGYILLGAVIEQVTGKPWCAAMRERLFEPLGMHHTGCDVTEAILPGRVSGYETDPATHVVTNARFMSMTVPASAGALISNADDLRLWMRALSQGRVIDPARFVAMMTPASDGAAAPTAHPYGLGLYVWRVRGETMVGHTGQINGFASILAYIPSRDVTIIALGNDDNFDARTFGRRLAGIVLGRPYPIVSAVAADPAALATLTGVYRVNGNQTVTLSMRDRQLFAQRTGHGAIPLQMAADGRFYFVPDELSYFLPVRNETGAVVSLDYFENGEGLPQAYPRTAVAP
jgi:CubicO group peptidase (beta-lactamase class C family)